MTVYTLNRLEYDKPKKGESFLLYCYDSDGYHRGGQWFTSGPIRYPEEEITAECARVIAEKNLAKGLEVRITNSGDFLVFHAVGERILHGDKNFWTKV